MQQEQIAMGASVFEVERVWGDRSVADLIGARIHRRSVPEDGWTRDTMGHKSGEAV